jgi:hypothetical protein
MREPYICQYCDQRSTRWWNLKIHMKRKHGGFLLGHHHRNLGSNPPWYSKSVPFETVADSVGNTFQPIYLPQQGPPQIPQNFANPLYRPMPTMNDQRCGASLSQGAVQKIQELKRLMNRYPQYHTDPDGIIRLAIYNSINGDNNLLDDKLEQLRTIDSLAKFYVGPS